MKLYIPLATGQSIPQVVLKSLADQILPIDVVPCCTPGAVKSNRNYDDTRLRGEVASRNMALEMICSSDDEYALMQDRDIVQLYNDNYFRAVELAHGNRDIGILALPWKDYDVTDHIRMQSLVIQRDAVKNFMFRYDKRRHTCVTMVEDMAALGYRCEFMKNTDKKMIREVL